MTKDDVRLRLSFSGSDKLRADRFLLALQELIESAARDGLEVTVNSGGSEVSVMNAYDPNLYTLQSDLDHEIMNAIREHGMRPEGVWSGQFVYRKDSLALLRMIMVPDPDAAVSLS